MSVVRRILTAAGGGGGFPSPYDDEFNDGINHGWTLAGASLPTFTGSVAHMPSGSAMGRARIPPMPFTVTAHASSIVFDNINTTYAGSQLSICQSSPLGSPGPLQWGPDLDVDILGTICMFDGRWSNFATQTGHLHAKEIETAGITLQVPFWLRIVVHSATNMDAYYSFDGSGYSTYATGLNPTLTPGGIMFLSFGCTTEWDWVRFTA